MNLNKLHTLGIDIGSTVQSKLHLRQWKQFLTTNVILQTGNIIRLARTGTLQPGLIQVSPNIQEAEVLLAKHLGVPLCRRSLPLYQQLCKTMHRRWCGDWARGEDENHLFWRWKCRTAYNGARNAGHSLLGWPNGFLLQTDASGLTNMQKNYKAPSHRGSRCGICQIRHSASHQWRSVQKILPLLFSGCRKPDNQRTCMWKPIRVDMLHFGGPLHFLSELREPLSVL